MTKLPCTGFYYLAISIILLVGIVINCNETPTIPKKQPVSDQIINFTGNQKFHYDSLSLTVYIKDAPDGSVFSVFPKPSGSKLDSITGAFGWKPTVFDFGVHTLVFSAKNGTTTLYDTVKITVATPALSNPTNYFELLSPNGGETYKYGDSITVIWLQNYNHNPDSALLVGEIKISSNDGKSNCFYYDMRSQHPNILVDTILGFPKYFKKINSSIAIGSARILANNKPPLFEDCSITFAGSMMRIFVGDQYRPIWDFSDAPFTIIP